MIQHTKSNRCPVCSGAQTDPRGKSMRCWGFTSDDGLYVRCTREEAAGPLELTGSFYVHYMQGICKCGATHNGAESNGGARHVLATYEYRDEQNAPLYRVLRYIPKSFSQERWDEKDGKYVGGSGCMDGVRRVLYRLPELLASQGTVLVVEGEKDADTGWWLEIPSTTNVGGAGKWSASYNGALKDRDVIIIPHGDAPGQKHAQDVLESLRGHAKSVKILPLEAKDLTVWVEAGGTREAFEKLSKDFKPFDILTKSEGITLDKLTSLIDVKIEYVIEPLCPEGTLTLVQGMPKGGKSTFSLWLALSASMGLWPSGVFKIPKPRKVLFIEFEDSPLLIVKRAARYLSGAGLDGYTLPETFTLRDSPYLLLDLPNFEAAFIEEIKAMQYELVVIDTLSYVHGAEDENASVQMKLVTAALKRIVKATRVSIILVHHAKKGSSESSIAEKARGSSAISASADIILDWGDRKGTDITPVEMVSKYDDGLKFTVEYKRKSEGIEWILTPEVRDEGDKAKATVLQHLREEAPNHPSGVPAAVMVKLLGQLGISRSAVHRYLNALFEEKKIDRVKLKREFHYTIMANQ